MSQLRKNVICLGLISAVAVVIFAFLSSVEVRSSPGGSSQPERPKAEAPYVAPMTFEPPARQPSERRLIAGVSHVYQLPMEEGELLELIVDQKGVDLQVEVLDPKGKPLFTVDSPNGDNGPERVLLVARESAPYRAQVSTRGQSGDGKYRIWIEEQRRATPEERTEARAEELFLQAKETKEAGAFSSRESKLQEAARLWEQTGNDGRQADAFQLLGDLYAAREQHRKSIEMWRRAKSLDHEARRWGDVGGLANDIGTSHLKLSELDLADQSYGEALNLGNRDGNAQVTAAALYNLGYISWRRGKSLEALERLEPARIASKKTDKALEGKTVTAIGLVFSSVGKTGMALARFREALAIFEALNNEGQKAIALTQMGNAYVRRGNSKEAREFYQRALEIQERIQDERNLPVTLNGLGLTHLNEKRPQRALEFFLKSLQLARTKGQRAQEAGILTNLGWTYSELEREADAYSVYEQALHLAERTEDQWMKTAALLGLALLEETRGDPIEARIQADAAVRSVEELREGTSPDFKIPFLASQQDVYDTLIDILLWQHELRPSAGFAAQALRVSEQARSRGLLDKILERSPARRGDETLQNPPVLPLEQIQRSVLGPDTLLLEYHLGRRTSYLWLVDKTSFKIFKLPPREELKSLAERTLPLLSVSNRREKRREARKAAKELSKNLISPAVAFLGQKRLLISAPDILQAVPFSALPDPAALEPETGLKWPRPLIVNHEVIKVPSASVLAALQARAEARTPPQGLLAMLADPVFNFHDERFKRLGLAIQGAQPQRPFEILFGPLKRLLHTRDEAESILGEVGARGAYSAFDFDASRDLVLSGKLREFRNIHIATHGRSSIKNADLSALVFSLVDSKGRSRDGRLQASDIYDLDLPADLITLSACETGLGERVPGEGLMGLPHAFFTAGATRVVVSLWKVDDLATARLMKQLYHGYLTQGHSPAAALREAQIAMWKTSERNAPFYWGGFELQGDWRAVESPR